ncbi:hypothetical protein J2756_000335 [Methanobacterium aggregans]|nr:hypothetical protein [Methanobacterium aggregans]
MNLNPLVHHRNVILAEYQHLQLVTSKLQLAGY